MQLIIGLQVEMAEPSGETALRMLLQRHEVRGEVAGMVEEALRAILPPGLECAVQIIGTTTDVAGCAEQWRP